MQKGNFGDIRPGSRVTIDVPAGLRMDGGVDWKQRTGKAVMRSPAGWVLNMGGPYGTPGIATLENFVSVQVRKGKGE